MIAFEPLRIGPFHFSLPIVQGGMGVRISKSRLASAVSNAGGLGTIASVGLGEFENLPGNEYVSVNNNALRTEVAKARKLTNRPFAVNIMGALTNYYELVTVCVEEKVDIIVTGAGIPLDLPKYVPVGGPLLIPIVSSAKALDIIIRRWKKRFDRCPAGVVIEGPLAGGHLGYSFEYLQTMSHNPLLGVLKEVKALLDENNIKIPIIVGGGIFDGKEAYKYLAAGANGIQMASRFVCTVECDAHINFKNEYLRAKKEDIVLLQSPVGLPGRVIKNQFVNSILEGNKVDFTCTYQCLKTCNPNESKYCIAKLLADAAEGRLENAFAFAGQNAYRCDTIVTVAQLVETLKQELYEAKKEAEKEPPK